MAYVVARNTTALQENSAALRDDAAAPEVVFTFPDRRSWGATRFGVLHGGRPLTGNELAPVRFCVVGYALLGLGARSLSAHVVGPAQRPLFERVERTAQLSPERSQLVALVRGSGDQPGGGELV